MKIFLLEDNKRLNETIVKKLEFKGYCVESFEDGAEAMASIDGGYDCFVLDINVPSVNGIKILREIKKSYSDTPIVMISALIEIDTIREAYGLGCEDYIKKPFYIDELEIKIEKLTQSCTSTILLTENVEFNMKSGQVTEEGREVKLTKKELLLLRLLCRKKNLPVAAEEILQYVWEGEFASPDTMRMLVMRLRKKLPKVTIETLIDSGYRIKID